MVKLVNQPKEMREKIIGKTDVYAFKISKHMNLWLQMSHVIKRVNQ